MSTLTRQPCNEIQTHFLTNTTDYRRQEKLIKTFIKWIWGLQEIKLRFFFFGFFYSFSGPAEMLHPVSETNLPQLSSVLHSALLRYLNKVKVAEPEDHLIKLCKWEEDDLDIQYVKGDFLNNVITALNVIMRGFTGNPGSYLACQSSHQSVWNKTWARKNQRE